MIRKLQIKFVAMCMILVTAVLGVVFTAVFFSAKQNIEVISHQVLQRVCLLYTSPSPRDCS